MDERDAYVALNMMEKVGPVGVRSLVETLGSVVDIFEAARGDLCRAAGVGKEMADAIVSQRDRVPWRDEMEMAERLGARIVTRIDEEYPELLKQIHDPPLALYVRGKMECRDRHSVAIVGTRRASHYGRETAERIAFGLAKAGMVVVSGLALGIDTSAHRGALRARGRTVAVLGAGFEHLYPPENAELANEIGSHGAVITEFPIDRRPDKTTFPMRNRIVSGLSKGVVVVEAGTKSGAMITVGQALEQGRAVFAVPGRIDSPGSRGPHEMIRTGATLVTGPGDILEEFDVLLPRGTEIAPVAADLSVDEQRLVALLADGERDVDALIRGTSLAAARVGSLLITMEMKRVVRMLPGRVVELVHR